MNSLRGLDILQELIDDSSITEIMVNGPNDIYIEKNGVMSKTDLIFQSPERLHNIIQQIVSFSNRRVNEMSPITDARLRDGSRVNIVLNPIAMDGPAITIRKFQNAPLSIDRLIKLKSITKEAADFLEKLVISGYNIFISGGTSSGKTTFLNVLSNFIPKDQRVITIEDSAELSLIGVNNIVRLEMRQANLEGTGAITIRDLIHSSLRMRPDRLIIICVPLYHFSLNLSHFLQRVYILCTFYIQKTLIKSMVSTEFIYVQKRRNQTPFLLEV